MARAVSNLLTEIKRDLRITNDGFDGEVQDLIDGAKADLKLSGVNVDKTIKETYTPEPTEEIPEPDPVEIQVIDPLIKRAISLYAKAHFGLDNADSEKYMAAFTSLKTHLTLSAEYTEV